MITNVSGQIRYQYNDHERFLGPLITGNVHRAHDHIHDLQRLKYYSKGNIPSTVNVLRAGKKNKQRNADLKT